MMLIIRGRARAELCGIRKKDQEKHYFEHRASQLYKLYPDEVHRMTIYKYGVMQKKEEEVLVYPENSLVPDHPRGEAYQFDKLASELDGHKIMLPKKSFGNLNLAIKQMNATRKSLAPMVPVIIVAAVLAYSFLFGGS